MCIRDSFYTFENIDVAGLQLSLENIGNIESLHSDIFDVTGNYYINDNQLTLSFYHPIPQSIEVGEVLFSIVFNQEQEFNSRISEGQFVSEIYEGDDLIKRPIELKFDTDNIGIENRWSAHPNPFSEETDIRYLSKDQNVVNFSFYKLDGQLLYSQNIKADNGFFQLKLNQSVLADHTGIIYCIVNSETTTESYKLLLIK